MRLYYGFGAKLLKYIKHRDDGINETCKHTLLLI